MTMIDETAMTDEAAQRTFRADGCSIHYVVKGDPAHPPVVLLHPAFGDHGCFERQIDVFAARHRVVALDLPGHGQSRPERPDVTLAAASGFVAAILEREGLAGAHLVGVSLGSLIAQDVALRFPQLVRTLTVVGGYSIFGPAAAIKRAQAGEMLKWLALVLVSMPRFRRYVARHAALTPQARERFLRSAQSFTRGSLRVMSGMGSLMRKTPAAHRHPLLIVTGEHELPVLRAHAADWLGREPGSEHQVIARAGHCANMDQPAAFNAAVLAFIERHGAESPSR